MGDLGSRFKAGALSADNPYLAGGWAVSFTPEDLSVSERRFEIWHIAVRGPAQPSCSLQMWLDTTFFSATVRGDLNDYDPNQAVSVLSGQTINFYWNTTTGPAPVVTIFLRQPSPI